MAVKSRGIFIRSAVKPPGTRLVAVKSLVVIVGRRLSPLVVFWFSSGQAAVVLLSLLSPLVRFLTGYFLKFYSPKHCNKNVFLCIIGSQFFD